ncbi:peptidyl-prolyl cis-trans isomerase B (cyclophilin B) [Pontibacter ummariensis]|uniref:peptidylprolyl isomerase n=1 Tax=Pontibacter ummariensis TaxID=1610492 RepID=A0A239BFV7_9BACT|nr:peptidylprolyl isomerase [Pontibacter ummariensis]PRY16497.1 peptidyl-prolyl cis-trans isomerase B (cyclophilin B) [Pontibacter ummariensis]SNS06228.1 peptidyl-prolyl cis-trans isomerase B (cyclophilin B) [Pontibacter ummariensis]
MIKLFSYRALLSAFILASCLAPLASCNQASEEDQAVAAEEEEEQGLVPLTYENAVEVLSAYAEKHPDSLAVISTRHGDIKVRLYKETPLHRANFVRLTKAGFYNEGEFYRVVKDFAIQGGDSDERTMSQGGYKIPQEFNPKYIHKRGALAMARYGDERNPEKESSSHNFYIVTGEPVFEEQLRAYEAQRNIDYTPAQEQAYLELGGEPGLDTEYTVFGEVIEGMDVVEKIEQEPVDASDWPRRVVPHTIKIVKE